MQGQPHACLLEAIFHLVKSTVGGDVFVTPLKILLFLSFKLVPAYIIYVSFVFK